MIRILLLINESISDSSPNSICISKVVEFLEKKGVYTDVLCFAEIDYLEKISELTRVYAVENVYRYSTRISHKLIRKFCYECICPDINLLGKDKYLLKAESLMSENTYDLVVSSSGGFFSQIAAMKLKKKYKIRTLSIFLDPPVSLNFLYKKNRPYYYSMLHLEKRLFRHFDSILLEENLYYAYAKRYEACKKMVKIGMPLITEKCRPTNLKNESLKKIVFLGTLWLDIRNPQYVIELFNNFKDCQLCFFGGNQTYLVLKELGYEYLYCGYVKPAEIESIIWNADYLLNISNVNIVQTPSKIYEYISYGKPIINIIKNKQDKTVQLIEKYGNGISIFEKENEIVRLEEFMSKPIETVPFSEIQEKFSEYTPMKVAEIIFDSIALY